VLIYVEVMLETADLLGVEELATIYTVAPEAKPNEVRGRIYAKPTPVQA